MLTFPFLSLLLLHAWGGVLPTEARRMMNNDSAFFRRLELSWIHSTFLWLTTIMFVADDALSSIFGFNACHKNYVCIMNSWINFMNLLLFMRFFNCEFTPRRAQLSPDRMIHLAWFVICLKYLSPRNVFPSLASSVLKCKFNFVICENKWNNKLERDWKRSEGRAAGKVVFSVLQICSILFFDASF